MNNLREDVAKIALYFYAEEPCRICGEILTTDDVLTAVYAGYSKDFLSRSAHKNCWDALKNEPDRWVHK